jgi:transposase InsO family protein
VAQARDKLTPLGRALIVERVMVMGWAPARAAEAAGVSRPTVYKWVRRFTEEGPAGLLDRSSAPRRHPHALSKAQVSRILRARRDLGWGPHRLGPWLGHPRSTVYGVLRREGVPRLGELDRPTRTPIRYERSRPGELVHVDVKKLGRIPAGGGWRLLGRGVGHRDRKSGVGYDYLHVAVDDHSRLAYVEALPDERAGTVAGFFTRMGAHFEGLGIGVEEVMTDNAWCYTRSPRVDRSLEALGARHIRIRPHRPQTNGKAERFNRTLLEEWAYTKLYRSNEARLTELQRFLDFYNQRRPHTALGGRSPIDRAPTT